MPSFRAGHEAGRDRRAIRENPRGAAPPPGLDSDPRRRRDPTTNAAATRQRTQVRFDDTFVVRSRDLQWRSRVAVYEHAGSKVHPYALTFHNLMDDVPPQPVELKHANAGYV